MSHLDGIFKIVFLVKNSVLHFQEKRRRNATTRLDGHFGRPIAGRSHLRGGAQHEGARVCEEDHGKVGDAEVAVVATHHARVAHAQRWTAHAAHGGVVQRHAVLTATSTHQRGSIRKLRKKHVPYST